MRMWQKWRQKIEKGVRENASFMRAEQENQTEISGEN